MTEAGRGRQWWQRWGIAVFWLAFSVWAVTTTVRTARSSFEREEAFGPVIHDTSTSPKVNDFEGFWRCALRLSRGEIAYFPHTLERVEMPSKHGPFFETCLTVTVPLGPAGAAIAFQILSMVLLAASLALGQRMVAEMRGGSERPLSPWTAPIAFFLLIPFVHLAGKYNQTVFLMVFLFLWGLRLLPRHPVLAGAILALPGAIKLLPLVIGPWLLWKREVRAFAGWIVGLLLSFVPLFAHQGLDRGLEQLDAYQHMILADTSFEEYHERFQGLPSLVNGTVADQYSSTLESDAQELDWDGVRNFLPALYPIRGPLVLAACSLLVLGCMLVCRRRETEHPRRWLGEAGLVLMAMLLLTPHTFKHYMWWQFPAVLFACAEWQDRSRRPWATAFLAVILLAETLPHRGTLGFAPIAWQTLHVFHIFAIGGTLAFTFLALRLWRRRRDAEG